MDTDTKLRRAHIKLMRHPETCLYSGVILMGKTEMSPRLARALSPAAARIAAAGSLPFTGHILNLPKRLSDAAIQ